MAAVVVERTSRDFLFPREIREKVEVAYLQHVRKSDPTNVLKDEEILDKIPRDLLNIELQFRGESSETIKRKAQILNLPRGGGEVDLAGVVNAGKGSFWWSLKARTQGEDKSEIKDLKVYFWSETRKRDLGGEPYGAGCGATIELDTDFVQKVTGDGFQLNATDQRYLPVIGGTFYIFAFGADRKILLAAVRFVDSRYPDRLCPICNCL